MEQNANLALQAASRGYVLETGNITLEDDAKKLMVRQMENFADFLQHTDYEIGRLVDAVEEMGELDRALETYRTIETTYPETPEGREILKYIGRVESKKSL